MREYNVLIGAAGWLHDAWEKDFYPDDLPAEWRLGYYGNEFPVVLVPQNYWQLDSAEIREWISETDAAPVFICEWPAIGSLTPADSVRQKIAQLGDRVLGIVLPVHDQPDAVLLNLCGELIQQYPVCLDIQAVEPDAIADAFRARITDMQLGVCWHGDPQHVQDMAAGKLVVARIRATDLDPRAIRYLVEQCLQQSSPERSVALIFDGTPPSLRYMYDAGTILDLL